MRQTHTRSAFPHRVAGVALVEFAIALPLIMMVLVGIIEIGRLAYFAIEVGNAAHAGAEYGALNESNAQNRTGITNAAKNDGSNTISSLTVQNAVPVYTCSTGTSQTAFTRAVQTCSTGQLTTYVQVTVQGTITTLFNYGAYFGLPSSWTVTRTAIMRVTPVQS